MEDKKKKYEAPKVMRLDDRHLGRGDCLEPGNSDVFVCLADGSNADDNCQFDGSFAGGSCNDGVLVIP